MEHLGEQLEMFLSDSPLQYYGVGVQKIKINVFDKKIIYIILLWQKNPTP